MSIQLGGVNLGVVLPNGTPLFSELNFTFGSCRTGLVGKNGVGKSTLLELLVGRRLPSEGEAIRIGRIAILEQEDPVRSYATVADALHCADDLAAYARVTSGIGRPDDFDRLEGRWDLVENVQRVLDTVGIGSVAVSSPFEYLSGGEQARVRLARVLLSEPDFVLLDEPTNHLDHEARAFIYTWIQRWEKGLLVVSHDRRLLDLMDQIAVLDEKGLHLYGGNYMFYRGQALSEKTAIERAYTHARKEFKQAKKQAQQAKERQQRRSASGKHRARRTGVSPMAAGHLQRHAETTASKLTGRHDDKVSKAFDIERSAHDALGSSRKISIDLSSTAVPRRKNMVRARSLNFRFDPASSYLWNEPLDFDLVGPDRVAIRGLNGSGKSTLLSLIRGDLRPTRGSISIGARRIASLDQQNRVLDTTQTLIQNVRRVASSRPEHELRLLLARFLFDRAAVDKPADVLSGGERIRAGLVCLLCQDQAPDMLVLDEPANNLDLDSVEEMVSVLNQFQGTLIVVSHDETFLDDIGIRRILDLDAV